MTMHVGVLAKSPLSMDTLVSCGFSNSTIFGVPNRASDLQDVTQSDIVLFAEYLYLVSS